MAGPLRLRRDLEFHVLAAVAAGAVADVDPAATFLVDALVNGQVEALDERQQAAVSSGRADGDVGGLATLVLAARCAAHGLVQRGTAVAAVHPDGATPGFAQGIEHLVNQFVQGPDRTGGRRVVDVQATGGVRPRQLVDGEVFHRKLMRMWALG